MAGGVPPAICVAITLDLACSTGSVSDLRLNQTAFVSKPRSLTLPVLHLSGDGRQVACI
jgi:hypothetical protein